MSQFGLRQWQLLGRPGPGSSEALAALAPRSWSSGICGNRPMSQLLIQHYLNELQTLRRVSGTSRETVVREAQLMTPLCGFIKPELGERIDAR